MEELNIRIPECGMNFIDKNAELTGMNRDDGLNNNIVSLIEMYCDDLKPGDRVCLVEKYPPLNTIEDPKSGMKLPGSRPRNSLKNPGPY
jgi:hypothetical protein